MTLKTKLQTKGANRVAKKLEWTVAHVGTTDAKGHREFRKVHFSGFRKRGFWTKFNVFLQETYSDFPKFGPKSANFPEIGRIIPFSGNREIRKLSL